MGLFTTEVTTVISWDFNGSQLNLDTDEHYKLDYVYYEEDLTPKVNFSLLIKEVTERDTGKYRCRVITPGWSASDMIFLSLVKPRKFTDHASNTLARRGGVETGGSKLAPFRTLHFQTSPFFLVFLPFSLRATSPPTDLSSPRSQRAQESLLAGYPPFNPFVDFKSHALLDNFPPISPASHPFQTPTSRLPRLLSPVLFLTLPF